jgi:hypothetical protein
MNLDYPIWGISTASQAAAELAMGGFTVVALVYCVWLARREREIWPLMVWAAGAPMAMYETLNNVLAHVAYPTIGQHTAFTLFGRAMPVYLVLVYMCYFGIVVPMLMKRFEDGVTKKQVMTYFGLVVAMAAVFEPIPVALDWWTYYGDNQPLKVLGIPMWWWFANAAAVVGTAAVFAALRKHVFTADWQSIFFIPLSLATCAAWHLTAAFPTYAAIAVNASSAVTIPMSLLTCVVATTWAFLMSHLVASPTASSGTGDPEFARTIAGSTSSQAPASR